MKLGEMGWSPSFVEKSDSRGHGHIYVICADDRLLPGDLKRDQENLCDHLFFLLNKSHQHTQTCIY